jgi:hypothetical protein
VVLFANCGGIGGMQGMHGRPDSDEGSLDEMLAAEFCQANYASCHGEKRQGGVAPSLVPSRLIESDEHYFETIALGRAGTAIPSCSTLGLSDNDIEALVEFLRTEP